MSRYNAMTSVNVPSEDGQRFFDWQTCKYYDFASKLNWCAILIRSLREQEEYDTSAEHLKIIVEKPWFIADEMEKLLKKVCLERLNLDVNVIPLSADSYDCDTGYIDHQSNVGEAPENVRMFMSEDMLYDFLANDKSYIDNSNDNYGREYEYDDVTNSWRYDPPVPPDYSV